MKLEQAIGGRLKKIRARIKSDGFDALLITSNENVAYTTGFSGDDSWAIIFPKEVMLITDGRYIEQAKQECNCKIINRNKPMTEQIVAILNRRKSVKIVATEGSIQAVILESLKNALNAKPVATANIVANIRRYKDGYEIACIKKAASIAEKILNSALGQLRIGITENEFAGILELQMRKALVVPAFETIVAFGANASCPHYQPGNRRLRKKDTILIDYGVKYKGYCCDITRCFAVGEPTKAYRNAYAATCQAQAKAIEIIKEGVKMSDVDRAAREVIKAAGLPNYCHSTGHGFGLAIHEQPNVYKSNETPLQAGDVITIEPGVYIEGKLGIRIEDDILVTKQGYKILTRSAPIDDCPKINL